MVSNEKNAKVKDFDLNLLKLFDSLFIHSSVTDTAKHLGLTPSAVSQSLKKLRTQFNDPLFVRVGTHMEPTTFCFNLHEQVKAGFGLLMESLTSNPQPTEKKQFFVYASPYLALRYLPDLIKGIERQNYGFEIVHYSTNRLTPPTDDLLNFRKADIILDITAQNAFSMVTIPLHEEKTTFICSKNHPRISNNITPAKIQKEKFTFMNTQDYNLKGMQKEISELLGDRQLSFISNSWGAIMDVVGSTETIGIVPTYLAERFGEAYNINALSSSIKLPSFTTYLTYNKIATRDPVFNIFINIIKDVFNENKM